MDWITEIVRVIAVIGGWELAKAIHSHRQWRHCPISTCQFRLKCSSPSVGIQMMSDHVIRTHHTSATPN